MTEQFKKKSFATIVNRLEKIFPIKKLLGWLFVWGILVVVFHKILYPMHKFDVPNWFPISEFHRPHPSPISGIPFGILFVILLGLTIWKIDSIKEFFIGCLGCVLIVLGNLVQGNFNNAFIHPLAGDDDQYYHDVVRMTNWRTWLAQFNNNQHHLAWHSQTHPPFAVIIQKFFLAVTGNISGVAILLSLSSMI